MKKTQIYSLLLMILMVVAPHALHLPLTITSLCLMFLLWRAYLTYTANALPKRWLLFLITFAIAAGILSSFHTLFGREAGVALLILLTTLKFMELHTVRDATVLIYLACFIIITNFFYSQSIPVALYMLATLLVIITVWIQLSAPTIALKARCTMAATLLLQALPLTLLLFVLFPRVQGPLWGMPQDAFASSGLDDKMTPGSLSRLILSDEVAFRVSYANQVPRREQMYWRGPVLWNFDGRTWTPGRTANSIAPQFTETKQAVAYTVTLEPHNKNWLFALEMPEWISVPAALTYDFQVIQKDAVTMRSRYEVRSVLQYHANLQEAQRQLRRGVQLPPGLNPESLKLANSWLAGNPKDIDIVRYALEYFNKQNFQYTLEPPPLPGIHGVDDFLFTTRQGFCEHYASAFVFLMRAAHIPARVVTGYQGGEYNQTGNYYIVRQSDAHAWAEVWLTGQGWVRIDPTAAIAPGRVQRGLSASVKNNDVLPFMSRNPPEWLHALRLNWDSLANQWNQWVLGYNSERQYAFMSWLGMESVSWQKMALDMIAGLTLLVGIFALYMLRHFYVHRPDRVQVAWEKLCKRMAKAGLSRAAHEGAGTFAARIATVHPELAEPIQNLAARYNALRYAGQAKDAQEFIRLCAKFRLSRQNRR